jgi:transposase-like protein
MQKNVIPYRRKGCPDYSPEFKQQLVATSCEPGIFCQKKESTDDTIVQCFMCRLNIRSALRHASLK